jgi:hypothetical protein
MLFLDAAIVVTVVGDYDYDDDERESSDTREMILLSLSFSLFLAVLLFYCANTKTMTPKWCLLQCVVRSCGSIPIRIPAFTWSLSFFLFLFLL